MVMKINIEHNRTPVDLAVQTATVAVMESIWKILCYIPAENLGTSTFLGLSYNISINAGINGGISR